MAEHVAEEAGALMAASMDEEIFFSRLYAQHRRMYAVAYSYLRSEADALEAVQEATCRAWMKRRKLKDDRALASWVLRITINCCMDELRRKKRWFPAEDVRAESPGEMISGDRIDLERALARMKPKYRHAVMLKYYHEMTVPEIAEVLGKPEGTVKTWLREGLRQLRGHLSLNKGGGDTHG